MERVFRQDVIRTVWVAISALVIGAVLLVTSAHNPRLTSGIPGGRVTMVAVPLVISLLSIVSGVFDARRDRQVLTQINHRIAQLSRRAKPPRPKG